MKTKTKPQRTLRIITRDGMTVLVITVKTARTERSEEYRITENGGKGEFGPGQAYQLARLEGLAIDLSRTYDCFVADEPEHCSCDCLGFASEATFKKAIRDGVKPTSCGCKHLDALKAAIAGGKL